MKIVLVNILLIFTHLCFADDFLYHDESKEFSSQSKVIRNLGSIEGIRAFYTTEYSSYQLVDQVFEGQGFEIFVKIGLNPKNKINKQMTPFKEGYLYHDQIGATPIAFYFRNLSLEKSLFYKKKLLQKLSKSKKVTLLDLFIPQAKASDCEWNNGLTPSKSLNSMQAISEKFQIDLILDSAKSCVMNALSGAWSATGGLVEGAVSGLWSFIKSPIKSANEFWDSAVSTFDKTKEFLTHFKSSILELKDTLASMPLEAQTGLICNIVSTVGTGVLVGILTGGPAGMLRGLTMLASKVSQVKTLASSISLLGKIKLPKDKLNGLMSKILDSKNKNALEDMEFMAKNNMENLTLEIASCGL